MQVPVLKGYFPAEEEMDDQQLIFYQKVEKHLKKAEYIDVDGNIGYIFVYLYKLLRHWKAKGFESLSEFLIYISELYVHEKKLYDYCLLWAYDCLLGLGKYDEYLDKTEPKEITGTSTHTSNLRINIQRNLGMNVNPIDILLMLGGRKTSFIVKNEALYKDKIIERFDEYKNENGGWFSKFDGWLGNSTLYYYSLFNGAPIKTKPKLETKIKSYYSAIESIEIIKMLSIDAENLARDERGLPRVGEGWISETELYRKLEKEFSETKVVQHGRPSWLGRQHFDIWFPNWKLAVEYHGKQHFEPVEFFGGEEVFKQTVERDQRKINLAKKNGVFLIVVTENDDQDELIQSIHYMLQKRKIVSPLK